MKTIFIAVLILVSLESFTQTIDRSVLSSAGNHSEAETIFQHVKYGPIDVNYVPVGVDAGNLKPINMP